MADGTLRAIDRLLPAVPWARGRHAGMASSVARAVLAPPCCRSILRKRLTTGAVWGVSNPRTQPVAARFRIRCCWTLVIKTKRLQLQCAVVGRADDSLAIASSLEEDALPLAVVSAVSPLTANPAPSALRLSAGSQPGSWLGWPGLCRMTTHLWASSIGLSR